MATVTREVRITTSGRSRAVAIAQVLSGPGA